MTLLNQADKIMRGTAQASAVYAGATKVWPSFKPNDLSGCTVWMDATKLTGADGSFVYSWTNQGSGGSPVLHGTPAPVLRKNALNGLQVVKITGGESRWRFNATAIDMNYTVALVARKWSLKPGRVLAANTTTAAGNPNILWGFHGAEFDCAYVEGWFNTPGPLGGITATTQWKLYSGDSTSTEIPRLFSNGVLLGVGPQVSPKGMGFTACLPGWDGAYTQEPDCEIAELVMYNRKLTDAERQTVEKYLREKWSAPTLFKPADLSANCLGWFDGADASSVQRTGTGVSNWVNKGVGAMTLTQATDAYKPSYNGSDTVNITSPQALMSANSPTTFDVVLVGRPQPVPRGEWRTLLRGPISAPVGTHHIIVEAGATRLGCYNTGFFPAGSLTWDNVWGICYGRFSDAAAATMSRDGGAMVSTLTTVALASLPIIGFGGYQGPPPSQGWGDIKEIIFLPYNSEGLRPQLEGYLAHRHGLAGLLPGGHPYKNAPP